MGSRSCRPTVSGEKPILGPEPSPSLYSRFFPGDKVLWIIIAVLAVISVLVVYSSTAKMAYDAHTARSTAKFLRDQLFVLCIAGAGLLLFHRINYGVYKRFSFWIYGAMLLLTVATYFIGHRTNDAARWIPILGFHFQPSEGLKLATVLLLVCQLAARQKEMTHLRIVPSFNPLKWSTRQQRETWRRGTLPILAPVVLSCLVIFPAHTSSAVLVFGISWMILLIGRVRRGELLKILALVAAAAVVVFLLGLGRSHTAGGRLSTWKEVWTEDRSSIPLERLSDTERSMIAIYNGGIFGKGAGQSDMRVEMTHPESDYAYAFFIEEYGLVMGVVVLLLYLWIFFRSILIFEYSETGPGLLVLGLGLLITCQALLHVMVTVNLIPETGQTLPLISRGGSSTLFTALALGMMLSVSRQNEEQSHDRPRGESHYENNRSA